MARTEFQGPFLGFTYNGRHSSDLGIVRINTGNRAEMPLSPSFKDSTAEVPGGKGLYYFNTQVQQRQFTINFAYDDLDEAGVHELRKWLDPTQQGKLIFDEEPYKEYTVKPNTQPKLSYLVFDREITTEDPERGENDPPIIYLPSIVKSSGRIYKGEGAIGLTAYYPYARAPYKTIGEYVDGEQSGGFGNKDEWQSAARIPESYIVGDGSNTVFNANLFNPGDIKTPLNCKIKSSEKGIVGLLIKNNKDDGNTSALYYIYLDLSNEDILEFIIDSKLQLVKDLKGNPRNDLIIASTFLYVDPCENGQTYYLDIYKDNNTNEVVISNIDYDYLYL